MDSQNKKSLLYKVYSFQIEPAFVVGGSLRYAIRAYKAMHPNAIIKDVSFEGEVGINLESLKDIDGGNNDSNQPKIGELLPGSMVSEKAS